MATIDIATLATELNTDPRTARKFLRTITPIDDQPGKGSRWAIEKVQVRSLKSKFTKFKAHQEQERLDREANRAIANDSTDQDLIDTEEIETLEDAS